MLGLMPMVRDRRRNSRMSLGSTQPGMIFTWLRLRPLASQRYFTRPFTMFEKPVTCDPI